MGRKTAGKKTKPRSGGGMDSLEAELSDLFKTLPPIKRAELTKVVEKLFQVTSNFASEPTTPAKQWEEFQEISQLVEKVRSIEQGYSMCRTLPDRRSAVKPFLAWLTDLGAVFNKVEVADCGVQGLGLKMKENVQRGEEVLRIPQKAMLSVDTARASSIGTLIERDPLLKTMPNVVLAIHLLIERNSPASIWEPYINILPHAYNTVLYFTPQQLEGLKGSPALEDALKQYKFVARQYAYFYRLFANTLLKDYLTYDEYRWAVSTVMTRQNVVPGRAESTAESPDGHDEADRPRRLVNTLIPLWDLANHEQGDISTDYDVEEGGGASICLAHRDFAAGDQLTIYYGVRSNSELLIHNGFVYPENPDDSLRLRLGVAKTDPLAAARLALLERVGVVSQKFFLRHAADAPLDPKLLAFLRVLQMDASALAEWQACEDVKKILDIQEAMNVDGKVMQYMITRAALLLRAYPTTLEQDQQLLKDSTDEIEKLTCQLRLCEKKMLVNCVAYCEQRLQAANKQQQ